MVIKNGGFYVEEQMPRSVSALVAGVPVVLDLLVMFAMIHKI